MKRILNLACLALFIGLAAFTSLGRNDGKIEFVTAQGEQVFTCQNVPLFYDATANKVNFYFKPASFSSGDAANDAKLITLTQSKAYGQMSFIGLLEKSPKNLKSGASLNTAAVGRLAFAGRETSLRVPVTVTNTKGHLTFAVMAVVDWEGNPATRAAGKELGVQGPIRINLYRSL